MPLHVLRCRTVKSVGETTMRGGESLPFLIYEKVKSKRNRSGESNGRSIEYRKVKLPPREWIEKEIKSLRENSIWRAELADKYQLLLTPVN